MRTGTIKARAKRCLNGRSAIRCPFSSTRRRTSCSPWIWSHRDRPGCGAGSLFGQTHDRPLCEAGNRLLLERPIRLQAEGTKRGNAARSFAALIASSGVPQYRTATHPHIDKQPTFHRAFIQEDREAHVTRHRKSSYRFGAKPNGLAFDVRIKKGG